MDNSVILLARRWTTPSLSMQVIYLYIFLMPCVLDMIFASPSCPWQHPPYSFGLEIQMCFCRANYLIYLINLINMEYLENQFLSDMPIVCLYCCFTSQICFLHLVKYYCNGLKWEDHFREKRFKIKCFSQLFPASIF